MKKLLMRKRNFLILALALLIVLAMPFTSAYFADRVTHDLEFTTGTFTVGGYTLKRNAPVGPFVANEDVVATLLESNDNDSSLESIITMSAEWVSPDTSVKIFGNASASDNATITISGDGLTAAQTVPYTVTGNHTITFELPVHTLAAKSSDLQRQLTFHIPNSLVSTGELKFTFDDVDLRMSSSGLTSQYVPAAELDYDVRVGWAASALEAQNGKALMGFLTQKDANGYYGIEYGFEFNYSTSAMKDFSGRSSAKWSYYNDSVNRLSFAEGMTTIGDYAFSDFELVTGITLPETITAIGTFAFDNTSLARLTIPAAVTTFEPMSFGHINELTEITFNASASKDISFPTAGSATGAFYVYPFVDTTINGANTDAQAYDWIKDLRNPPMLAEMHSWYDDGTDYRGYDLTRIRFVSNPAELPATYDESWNAAVDRNGDGEMDDDIICYRSGSDLAIYANTATRIYGNPNSRYAFWNHGASTIENLSMLDTSKVTNMNYMFAYCGNLTTLDVSKFDTSNVTDMSCMFYLNYVMENIDAGNWDTGKVETMMAMFSDCESLTDLSSFQRWDTRNVQNFSMTFLGVCSVESMDLTSIPVTLPPNAANPNGKSYDSWDTGSAVTMEYMFGNNDGAEHHLKSLDISTFDTRNVTDFQAMFERCFSLEALNLNVAPVTLNGETFYAWDTGSAESMYLMFKNCQSLTELDLSSWDTSAIGTGENLSNDDFMEMFFGCSSLERLDVSRKAMTGINGKNYTSWDTSNAVWMSSMFEECASLQTLNLKDWTNTLATDMGSMFAYCSSLTSINFENFTTPSLDTASAMFYTCSALESLDVTSFDTSNLSYAYNMFSNCSRLEVLDLSNFVTTGFGYSWYFEHFAQNCTSLKEIILNPEFGQSAILPSAGSDGLFYVSDPYSSSNPLITTVSGFNDVMYNYNWAADNRAIAFDGPINIEISKNPNKMIYTDGSTFDPTGMQITVNYGDGTSRVLGGNEYQIISGENMPAGQGGVTISYTEDGKTMSTVVRVQVGYSVIYNANGGAFGNSATTNEVIYSVDPSKQSKISKTDNLNDDGSAIQLNYGVNKETVDVITIPGATSLEVTITYQTESTSYDWIALYQGSSITPSANNYGSSVSGKIGGTTQATQTFTISGDTVQIYFRSDGSACSYYGYHAVIRGVGEAQILSGTYEEPSCTGTEFSGWFNDAACGEDQVFELPDLNGNKTVYAGWGAAVSPTMFLNFNDGTVTDYTVK